MSDMIDLKRIESNKLRVSISELKLGVNYKPLTEDGITRLKHSLIDDDQIIPILVDVREDHMGEILGGNHQYKAIQELISEGRWIHEDMVWIDPVKPRDDNHAKMLSLKHNAQYDIASKASLKEWTRSLKDSDYSLIDIPVITDYEMITLDDLIYPENTGAVVESYTPETNTGANIEEQIKEKKVSEKKIREVTCPHCSGIIRLED